MDVTMTTTAEIHFNNSSTSYADEITSTDTELRNVKIICLVVIVFGCFICNSCAIAFINSKLKHNSEQSLGLKDKIVTLLCFINLLQPVGYLIELYSAINNGIAPGPCQVAAFTTCMLTYVTIGYFVALTVE